MRGQQERLQRATEVVLIELVLQVNDEADLQIVRELIGSRTQVSVGEGDVQYLRKRHDVDAIILGEHLAVEYYLAKYPRLMSEVVIDRGANQRVHVREATISSGSNPKAQLHAAAAWIVVCPDPCGAAQILNVFEVMEQHNATGIHTAIRRAGVLVDARMAKWYLAAYDIYWNRAQAGS